MRHFVATGYNIYLLVLLTHVLIQTSAVMRIEVLRQEDEYEKQILESLTDSANR
jgi:hypothetical protein